MKVSPTTNVTPGEVKKIQPPIRRHRKAIGFIETFTERKSRIHMLQLKTNCPCLVSKLEKGRRWQGAFGGRGECFRTCAACAAVFRGEVGVAKGRDQASSAPLHTGRQKEKAGGAGIGKRAGRRWQ